MSRTSTEEIEIRDILGLDDRTPDTVEAVRALVAERDTLRAECGYDWKAMCEAAEQRTVEAESRLAMATISRSCAEQRLLNAEIRADQWQAKAAELTDVVCQLEARIGPLESERQAILTAGGDFLWAGGAKTLPEAVAGICHAYTVELDRRERERDRSPAAKVRDTLPSVRYTDAGLVKLALEHAGSNGRRRVRWGAVCSVFGTGSDVASELCRACGLDPDEMVGDDGEGEE